MYLFTILLISVRSFSVISVFFGFIIWPITDTRSWPPCTQVLVKICNDVENISDVTIYSHSGESGEGERERERESSNSTTTMAQVKAVDVSDPRIKEAYDEIRKAGAAVNWSALSLSLFFFPFPSLKI
jgi:hypothetical protein